MTKKGDMTIITYDAVAMYLSIKLKLVIKSVNYFSKRLRKAEKRLIKNYLEIVKFGMTPTILSFKYKF